MLINVDDIFVDPNWNVREAFDSSTCKPLALSIGKNGLLQPVGVVPYPEGGDEHHWRLIFGFRRYCAVASILGWTEIDATVINNVDAQEASILNIIENLDRQELTYFEECVGIQRVFPPTVTIKEIAKHLSKSESWVRLRRLVWHLPEEVLADLRSGDLTPSDVSLVLQHTPEQQVAAAETIKKAKEEGKKTREISDKLVDRRSVRSKKTIFKMMATMMQENRGEAMNALRWAAGEIDDEEFSNNIGRIYDGTGESLPDSNG